MTDAANSCWESSSRPAREQPTKEGHRRLMPWNCCRVSPSRPAREQSNVRSASTTDARKSYQISAPALVSVVLFQGNHSADCCKT